MYHSLHHACHFGGHLSNGGVLVLVLVIVFIVAALRR